MAKQAVSFDEVAELIRKLDKVTADGSSSGTIRLRMDFAKLADGKAGLVGKASMSEELAAIAHVFPAGIQVEREKFAQWESRYDFDLEWKFGPGATVEFKRIGDLERTIKTEGTRRAEKS